MTPKERIEVVLLEHKIPSAESLAKLLEIDGDLIRNIISGRTKKMSGIVAQAISQKLPVSYKWLMTGIGVPEKKEDEPGIENKDWKIIAEDYREINADLRRTISFLQKTIEDLK